MAWQCRGKLPRYAKARDLAQSVNLSRRSLLFSLVFHGSLLVGGIFFTLKFHHDYPETAEGTSNTQVVTRPFQVKAPPKPPTRPPGAEASQARVKPIGRVPKTTEEPVVARPAEDSRPTSKPDTHLAAERRYPQAPEYPVSKPSPRITPDKRPAKASPSPQPFPERPPGWGVEPTKPNEHPASSAENGDTPKITRRAMPTKRPEFNLTARFPELKSVSVKAEFLINEDGTYEPTLVTSSGNPTADVVILGKLLEFVWSPALEKGKPVKDKRVLDIDLDE